jgi:WD40 repeat protein
MPYTYGLHGAPAVGGGLPGLPQRSSSASYQIGDIHISEDAPQGDWLVADGSAWDDRLDSGKLALNFRNSVRILPGINTPPTQYMRRGIAFSADSQLLFCATEGTIQPIYRRNDADVFNRVTTGVPTSNYVSCAAFAPDASFVAYGSTLSNQVYLWVRGAGDTFTTASATSLGFIPYSIDVSPDSSHVAVGGSVSPRFRIFKRNGNDLTTLTHPAVGNDVKDVKYSPDGVYLYVAIDTTSSSLIILKRNADTYTQVGQVSTATAPKAIAISRDGNHLVEGHATGLRVYQKSGDSLSLISGSGVTTPSVEDINFSPDGKFLFCASVGGLLVFEFSAGTLTLSSSPKNYPVSGVSCVKPSPDGKLLVSGTQSAHGGTFVQVFKAAVPKIDTSPPLVARIKVG